MSIIAYRKRIERIQEQRLYTPVHTDTHHKIRSLEYVDGLTTLYQVSFGISEDLARKHALEDQYHALNTPCEGVHMNSDDLCRFFDDNPNFLRSEL